MRDIRVAVALQIARLLGVIAVHRGTVTKRVEVLQPQLATLHVPRQVLAVGVEDQVAAPVGLEELPELRPRLATRQFGEYMAPVLTVRR